MISRMNSIHKIALAMGATFAMGAALPLTVTAQEHHSIIHRHHKAAGAIAGIAAYKAAKRTGNNRSANGRHRNIMQRHPFLTGAAAAAATNHYAKKHR